MVEMSARNVGEKVDRHQELTAEEQMC